MRKVGSEEELTWQLARYLQLQYPNVLYHIDFGSGTKLTMGQAVKQKQLNSRAWPDLFIASPKWITLPFTISGTLEEFKHVRQAGFFLELKREGTKLYLKDGKTMVANEHYQEQAMVLKALRSQGYYAEFGVGFNDAKAQIDKYLTGVV